mgnify:CR=1 FL=1
MIQLRYPKLLENASLKDTLLQVTNPDESDRLKVKVLQALGIEVKEGETPLVAWSRAMEIENGYEPNIPVAEEVAQAIENDPDAMHWMMYLAGASEKK